MRAVTAIILSLLFIMVLMASCTKECHDSDTLKSYQIELSKEQENQTGIQKQISSTNDVVKQQQLFSKLNQSISKSNALTSQIEELKKNSKCL